MLNLNDEKEAEEEKIKSFIQYIAMMGRSLAIPIESPTLCFMIIILPITCLIQITCF